MGGNRGILGCRQQCLGLTILSKIHFPQPQTSTILRNSITWQQNRRASCNCFGLSRTDQAIPRLSWRRYKPRRWTPRVDQGNSRRQKLWKSQDSNLQPSQLQPQKDTLLLITTKSWQLKVSPTTIDLLHHKGLQSRQKDSLKWTHYKISWVKCQVRSKDFRKSSETSIWNQRHSKLQIQSCLWTPSLWWLNLLRTKDRYPGSRAWCQKVASSSSMWKLWMPKPLLRNKFHPQLITRPYQLTLILVKKESSPNQDRRIPNRSRALGHTSSLRTFWTLSTLMNKLLSSRWKTLRT